MKEKIMELFIQCLPALIATFTCILTTFKVLKGIDSWKDSINGTNLHNLSNDMKNVVKRNLELQKKCEELLNDNKEIRNNLETKIEALLIEINNLKTKAEESIEEKEE